MDHPIQIVWDAAKKLNAEISYMSWSGFNLVGDKKSIDEVQRLQNEVVRLQAIIDRKTEVNVSATDFDKVAENVLFLGICRGQVTPNADCVDEGRKARDAHQNFHECPYPKETVKALSWRIGWNDRALELRDTPNEFVDNFS